MEQWFKGAFDFFIVADALREMTGKSRFRGFWRADLRARRANLLRGGT